MHLPRKSLFSLTLLVALFGMPSLASVHAPGAPGGLGHPPLIQLATLPRRARLRRRVRGSKVRAVLWRARLRLRGAAGNLRAAGESVQPRLPPHDSYARGPPRPPGRTM
jgi:hypothetical protein